MEQHDPVSWALETLFVHGDERNYASSSPGIPTVQPIYTSTTYLYRNAETLERAFTSSSEEQTYIYAGQGNPNSHALEDLLARIEGGVGAVTFGSGMAAIHAALLAAGGGGPGTKILAAQDLYGASIELLQNTFVPLGIEVHLCNLCTPDVADLIRREQPDVIYLETLSNPLVKVIDLDVISAAAHQVGAITIVDSTFTTPYLLQPIKHGFDLVVHSATKYLGGHGDSVGGVVISGSDSLLARLRLHARMLGAMLSPFEAYLIMRGLKTLPLRIERQCRNALQVAHFLQQHSAVSRVYYPGLPEHPQHQLASNLLYEQYGGLLAFELKTPTREAVFRFMDSLRLCLPVTTLGDVYSEVSYPALSSHRSLTSAERQNIGITDACVRLSVGIEHVEDIIADLDQALLA